MKRKPYKAKSLAGAQRRVRELQRQLDDVRELLGRYAHERKALAMLAADGPCFINPLDVIEARRVRREILANMNLRPDGTPLRTP